MIKNIAFLSAGSGIAQLLIFAVTPLLSRLYSPADFGVLAVILAASAIIIPFATLRYETALLIRNNEYPPASIFLLSVMILCVVTLILAFLNEFIHEITFDNDDPSPFRGMIIVVYVFILGLNSILTSWNSRFSRFKIISVALILQSLCAVSAQCYLGFASAHDGLIYGHLAGLIAYAVVLFMMIIRLDHRDILNLHALKTIFYAAREQKKFPIYSTWSSLLNGMANNLPNLLFAKFFNATVAGHYAMATRIVRNPLSIIGQSIYQVVAQHAGEHHDRPAELSHTLAMVLNKMAYIAIIPFLVMSLSLEGIVTYFLGNQWSETGAYTRILLPWLFLTYITWPLTGTYNATGQQGRLLFFNAIFAAGILLAFMALLAGGNVYDVLILLSLLGSFSRLYYLHWIFVQLGSSENRNFSIRIFGYAALIALASGIGQAIGW
jgi:O-antigen/teichoic acid export membrane protein